MERDAIFNGPGSVGSVAEIKILICYILKSINEPVPEVELTQLLHYEGIANYFDVSSAVSELIKSGIIVENENGFTVSDEGAAYAETLRTSVALGIRNKAIKAVAKMMTRRRHERETDIDVKKANTGYDISFAINEQDRTLMSVKLNVADKVTADFIKDRVLDDPSYVYAGLIELLTDEDLGYRKNDEIIKP